MKHKTIVPQNEKYLNSCRIFVNHSLYIIDSLKKFMLYFNIFFCSHYFSVRIKKRGGNLVLMTYRVLKFLFSLVTEKKKIKRRHDLLYPIGRAIHEPVDQSDA